MEQDWVQIALNTESDLKVVMKGHVAGATPEKVGVVSLVYVSSDTAQVAAVYEKLTLADPSSFYMIYAIDKDTRLDQLAHFPSIAIHKADLDET